MIATPNKFIANPSLAIVATGSRPVENTIKLGGVATGNMNAHEADNAAGIINSLGSVLAASAPAAMIGMSRVVVAVLLVTSVRKVTLRQMVAISTRRWSSERCRRDSPITVLSPELINADAMDIPAPNRSNIPHGILFAASQSSNFPPSPLGIMNRVTTPIKATIASFV